ncbi:MAG: hypothetical protein V4760_01595 [Bdellovibrionota bacterium]
MRLLKNPLFGAIIVVVAFALVYFTIRKPNGSEKTASDVSAVEVAADTGDAQSDSPTPAPASESGGDGVGSSSEETATTKPGSELATGTQPSTTATPSASTPKTTSGAPLQPVAQLIPSIENLRAEVAKNPHGTPQGLSKFSISLGDRLDALKNEVEAGNFMEELDECVTKPSVETTSDVKTLCLLNAKRVGEKFPALRAKSANLEARAPEKVRKALDALK